MLCGLEIKFLDPVSLDDGDTGFLPVARIDQHAKCHSNISNHPGRRHGAGRNGWICLKNPAPGALLRRHVAAGSNGVNGEMRLLQQWRRSYPARLSVGRSGQPSMPSAAQKRIDGGTHHSSLQHQPVVPPIAGRL
jgi:hypothetical protein